MIADLFNQVCRMLGISELPKVFVYPSQSGGSYWTMSSRGQDFRGVVAWHREDSVISKLHSKFDKSELIFFADGNGFINRYEAAILYNNTYYCLGEDAYQSTQYMMSDLVEFTYWYYQFGLGDQQWKACKKPGPWPQREW